MASTLEPQIDIDNGPTERSSNSKKEVQAKTSRTHDKGNKVEMRKNEDELWEYNMIVVDMEYDEIRKGWNYCLKEDNDTQKPWPKWVKETNMRKPKG